jgi:glycosyltransferase involved in cell wall biosynthesis
MVELLFVQSNAAYGACEEYLSLLIRGLGACGVRMVLLCPDGPPLVRLREEAAALAGVVPYRPAAHGLQTLAHLTREIRAVKPLIVHLNDPGVLAMAACRLARVPHKVLTFHTPRQPFAYNRKAQVLSHWGLRADWHVIAVSESNRIPLCHRYGFSSDRVHTIPYGLDTERLLRRDDRDATRRGLGIARGIFLLGIVGRLSPQKNHCLLFDSLSRMRSELRAQLRTWVIGDGELRVALEQHVRQLGLEREVVFLGHQSDVSRLLAALDALVLTSDYEGLPFAVLEAMAVGLPVVATAVDGVPDAVANGETGLLVPPGSVEALANVLEWLISHPTEAAQMGQAGHTRFLERYTQDRMVKATRQLYESISGLRLGSRDPGGPESRDH